MSTDQKTSHTPGTLELATPTKLWILGPTGGAVAIIADPECSNTGDIAAVHRDSPRFKEACANAERLVRCWNAHEDLFYCLQQIMDSLPSYRDWLDPDIEKLVRAALAKAGGKVECLECYGAGRDKCVGHTTTGGK